MTTTESNTRIITLTDRRPVTIVEDEWPEIASASYRDHDGEIEPQASRTWRGWLKVRQHADGRTLVYGGETHTTSFRDEYDHDYRAGEILSATDGDEELVAATRRVHLNIANHPIHKLWHDMFNQCIANLEPEKI